MILDTNSEVNIDFNVKGAAEIYQNIAVLFSTPKGTVAFNRDFGIDWSILDKPLPVAKALLTAEYIKKVGLFEPRAKVTEVKFEYDDKTNILKPKVVVEIVD